MQKSRFTPTRRPVAGADHDGGEGMSAASRAVLAGILLLALATAGAAADPDRTRGWKTTPIPLYNFSSDAGTGYGLRLNLYEYDGETVPYRRKYSGQLFFTTEGKWVHRVLMDSPAFRGRDERLQLELVYKKEQFANYYGGFPRAWTDSLTRDQRTFEQAFPEFLVTWIRPLSGSGRERTADDARRRSPWRLRVGGRLSRNDITPNAQVGNILADKRPLGAGGGTLVQINGALRYDTRNNYNNTTIGLLEELRVEYGVGAGGDFNGATASFQHRHFATSRYGLTLAHRLNVDWTVGDLPFYEELDLGGSSTVRGMRSARDRGQARVLLNGEVRWRGLQLTPSGRMSLGMLVFVDVGQIFDRDQLPAPGAWRRSAGTGLRGHWHSTIVRADYGRSGDRTGIYITFSQVF